MFTVTDFAGIVESVPTLGFARASAERASRDVLGDVFVCDRHGDRILRYRDGKLIGSFQSIPVRVTVVR